MNKCCLKEMFCYNIIHSYTVVTKQIFYNKNYKGCSCFYCPEYLLHKSNTNKTLDSNNSNILYIYIFSSQKYTIFPRFIYCSTFLSYKEAIFNTVPFKHVISYICTFFFFFYGIRILISDNSEMPQLHILTVILCNVTS